MGHVIKTPAGSFRANWRDPAGKQKAKTFKTKKEASAFLSDVESSINQGGYVDPRAGKVRFRTFAARWESARGVEERTSERTRSILRTHLLPRWGDWPIGRIDHLAVQQWVTDLGRLRAPATVTKSLSVLQMILRTAVRSHLIATNPADGVTVTGVRRPEPEMKMVPREAFFGQLLPNVPPQHRAIICVAAGAGLRWGECAGLAWGAVDLDAGRLHVAQVAVETAGAVTLRSFPKSRAGVRNVPLPDFVTAALRAKRKLLDGEPPADALVFVGRGGLPPRRANFRKRVWLPSLVRAGLLGQITQVGPGRFAGVWRDRLGVEQCANFATERAAIEAIALRGHGGLRFHDLRHSYASWLVTDGVPVNVVQKVMGHERASFTLHRYTHAPDDYEQRVRDAFRTSTDFPLTFDLSGADSPGEED